MDEHRGYYHRGYLPHLDIGDKTQSIAFRLGDSLPREVLDELSDLAKKGKDGLIERYEKAQYYLDQGYGSCVLREPEYALIVRKAIQFLHEKRYELLAWVVMPNHVHLLAHFGEGKSISKAMHSLKSFTSNEIAKLHPELKPIWQAESFDRYIRSEEHFEYAVPLHS